MFKFYKIFPHKVFSISFILFHFFRFLISLQIVLLFASPIVLLEELLKYVSRNKTQLKEAAMSKFKEAQAHAQAHAPHRPKLPPPMF